MGKEEFYDKEIAPVLADLAKKCQDNDLNLLALCEWDRMQYGRTIAINHEWAGLVILCCNLFAKTHGNVDSLIWAIKEYAQKHGHSSIELHRMGVPERPEPAP